MLSFKLIILMPDCNRQGFRFFPFYHHFRSDPGNSRISDSNPFEFCNAHMIMDSREIYVIGFQDLLRGKLRLYV